MSKIGLLLKQISHEFGIAVLVSKFELLSF